MDTQDFQVHLRICIAREEFEIETRMRLAGATIGTTSAPVEEKKTTTVGRTRSGALVENKSERVRPNKNVGDLVMDKRTGKVVKYNQPELSDKRES